MNFTKYILLGTIILFSCTRVEKEKVVEVDTEPWLEYSSPQAEGLFIDSLRKIDEVIQRLTEEGKIPGAAALVAIDGKIIYQTSQGFQDVDDQISMDTTSIFRIASMTKPITTVAILQLYEKGKLDLNDPLHNYIPAFKDPKVLTSFDKTDTTWESRKASRAITIHDLLTHTSGISYGFKDPTFSAIYAKNDIPDLAVASDRTIEEIADILGRMPLEHDPGEKFTYGLNTDVLGRVVEVASGMDLESYVNKNITGPLRMDDTRYFYDEEESVRFATVYVIDTETSAIAKMEPNEIYDPEYPVKGAKKYFSGGSGMSSTLQNYFVFSQMLLNGGEYKGTRILQDSTVQLMTTDQLGEKKRWADNRTFGYGLLIIREKNEAGEVGEIVQLGWSGAFNTFYFINPKEDVVGIIMSQVLMNPYGGELVEGFQQAIKNAKVEEEVVAVVE